jgi:hypothetical protein
MKVNETLARRLEILERALQEQGEQHPRQLQRMREHFQQEQDAMTQQVAALATQLAEQHIQQEQGRHHFLEQLTHLQEQFTALDQQGQRSAKRDAGRINRREKQQNTEAFTLLAREISFQQREKVKRHSESTSFLFRRLSCFFAFFTKIGYT